MERFWNIHNVRMVGEDDRTNKRWQKWIYLIREWSTIIFINDWEPLMDFLPKKKREMSLWFMGSKTRKGNLWKGRKYDVIVKRGDKYIYNCCQEDQKLLIYHLSVLFYFFSFFFFSISF